MLQVDAHAFFTETGDAFPTPTHCGPKAMHSPSTNTLPVPWNDPEQTVIGLRDAIGRLEDLLRRLEQFQHHLRTTFLNKPVGGWSLAIQSLHLSALRADHGGSPGGDYHVSTLEARLSNELRNLRERAAMERHLNAFVLAADDGRRNAVSPTQAMPSSAQASSSQEVISPFAPRPNPGTPGSVADLSEWQPHWLQGEGSGSSDD